MTTINEGTRRPDPAAPAESGGWSSVAAGLKAAARLFRRRMVYIIPAVMLLAGMSLYISKPALLQTLQYKVFDLYQQTKPGPIGRFR